MTISIMETNDGSECFSMDIPKPFMLEVNDNHSPRGSHSISSYLGDDTMMRHPHLTCEQVRRSVKVLGEPWLMWVVICDWIHSSIFTLCREREGNWVIDDMDVSNSSETMKSLPQHNNTVM